MVLCSSCKSSVDPGKFCTKCGTKAPFGSSSSSSSSCSKCNAPMTSSSKFCTKCGEPARSGGSSLKSSTSLGPSSGAKAAAASKFTPTPATSSSTLSSSSKQTSSSTPKKATNTTLFSFGGNSKSKTTKTTSASPSSVSAPSTSTTTSSSGTKTSMGNTTSKSTPSNTSASKPLTSSNKGDSSDSCSNCGTLRSGNSRFCIKCGEKVSGTSSDRNSLKTNPFLSGSTTTTPTTPKPTAPSPTPKPPTAPSPTSSTNFSTSFDRTGRNSATKRTCTSCKKESVQSAKFCTSCGKPFSSASSLTPTTSSPSASVSSTVHSSSTTTKENTITCTKCKTACPSTVKFCVKCGNNLVSKPPPIRPTQSISEFKREEKETLMPCNNCGALKKTKFCVKCGSSGEQAAPQQPQAQPQTKKTDFRLMEIERENQRLRELEAENELLRERLKSQPSPQMTPPSISSPQPMSYPQSMTSPQHMASPQPMASPQSPPQQMTSPPFDPWATQPPSNSSDRLKTKVGNIFSKLKTEKKEKPTANVIGTPQLVESTKQINIVDLPSQHTITSTEPSPKISARAIRDFKPPPTPPENRPTDFKPPPPPPTENRPTRPARGNTGHPPILDPSQMSSPDTSQSSVDYSTEGSLKRNWKNRYDSLKTRANTAEKMSLDELADVISPVPDELTPPPEAETRDWKTKYDSLKLSGSERRSSSGKKLRNDYADKKREEMKSTSDPRKKVLLELQITESEYLKHLEIITVVFMGPMRREVNNYCTREEFNSIFSNLEEIKGINEKLFDSLKSANDAAAIAKTFLTFSEFFKSYANFCNNQDTSIGTIVKLREKKDKKFNGFLEYCLQRPECENIDFNSYMIKPIQRICKYPLLLNEILKTTPDSAPEKKVIEQAFNKITDIVTTINERKRSGEAAAKMLELVKIIVADFELNLITPTRKLIRQVDINLLEEGKTQKNLIGFLFNDILLVTKKKGKQFKVIHYINLAKCLTRLMPPSDKFCFEIIPFAQAKPLCLFFESEDEQVSFLEEIQGFIDHLGGPQAINSPMFAPTIVTFYVTYYEEAVIQIPFDEVTFQRLEQEILAAYQVDAVSIFWGEYIIADDTSVNCIFSEGVSEYFLLCYDPY